jgi:uncharacterized protein (TIGR00369 family)
MNNPARNVGLLSPDRAGSLCGVDFLRGIMDGLYPAPPFSEVADVWPVSIEVGRIVFEAAPSARFYNPMGIVHGGWVALLLDTVMGCAVHSALQPGRAFATVDMTTSFVRPVSEGTGTLRAEGTLLHLGHRIASAGGRIVLAVVQRAGAIPTGSHPLGLSLWLLC